MRLFNCYPPKGANYGLLQIVTAAQCAHKFSININEVFGNMGGKTVLNWFKDKPDDMVTWLRPPYDSMYIEFEDVKTSEHGDRLGMYIMMKDTSFRVVPLLLAKNIVHGTGVHYIISTKGPLTAKDFDTVTDYTNWKNSDVPMLTDKIACSWIDGLNYVDLISSINAFYAYIPVLLESLMYINARGIGTAINRPKSIRSKIRKTLKKNKAMAHSTYKTLRIIKKGEPKEIRNKNNRIPFAVAERREHTVRGHIAVYTKDKPLFGNPKNVGPIWISPHVRNKGTEGRIIKDYEVK